MKALGCRWVGKTDAMLKYLIMCLTAFVLASCLKDYDFDKMTDPDWNASWAVPIVNSKLSLEKILNKDDNYFIEDEQTHQLSLVYKTQLLSQTAEEFLTIGDQNIHVVTDTLNIDAPTGDTSLYIITKYYQFNPPNEGQRIDSLFIKSALISLNYMSFINHNAILKVKIPGASKNGNIFQENIAYTFTGSLPVTGDKQLDFSGYKITLDSSPGHTNELAVIIELRVIGDNNPNNSPYTFIFDADITGVKFSKVFGYFGQYEFPFNDSITFNLFRNNIHGDFRLEDVKLRVMANNSMGMPLAIHIQELKAHSSINAPYNVNINDHLSFPNPLFIPAPDEQHIGQSADTTYVFSSANSKIINAINISPQYILFDIIGKSNPANNPNAINFIYDTSRFTVDLQVEMPLYGLLNGFWLQDTINFEINKLDNIEQIEFKINSTNHFPIDAEIQVYFADSRYRVLDSLIYPDDDPIVLKAAPVGGPPDYRVIENPPPQEYTFIPEPLTRNRLDKLENCKKLIIRPKLSTYQQGLVKIYSDYTIDVKIGTQVKLKSN
ncbi:MAG: hypothetical protein M0R21_00535 [Lentimicrobiaceae bacterium]|nr:hypothetical protein [Lentimicrobiaceae bacterium]